MIRKLTSGKYRLYSARRIPKPASGATWARSALAPRPSSTSVRCNSSSAIDVDASRVAEFSCTGLTPDSEAGDNEAILVGSHRLCGARVEVT